MRWNKNIRDVRDVWRFPIFWPIEIHGECRLWEWCHIRQEFIACYVDCIGWSNSEFLN